MAQTDPTRPRARPATAATRPPEADRLRPQARPEDLGLPPPEVAEAATEPAVLPLGETTLIGLMSGPAGSTALVRLGSGEVIRAVQGDVVGGGVVTAIAEGSLHLWRDGADVILTMPA